MTAGSVPNGLRPSAGPPTKIVLEPTLVCALVHGFILGTAWMFFTESRLRPRYGPVGFVQYVTSFENDR